MDQYGYYEETPSLEFLKKKLDKNYRFWKKKPNNKARILKFGKAFYYYSGLLGLELQSKETNSKEASKFEETLKERMHDMHFNTYFYNDLEEIEKRFEYQMFYEALTVLPRVSDKKNRALLHMVGICQFLFTLAKTQFATEVLLKYIESGIVLAYLDLLKRYFEDSLEQTRHGCASLTQLIFVLSKEPRCLKRLKRKPYSQKLDLCFQICLEKVRPYMLDPLDKLWENRRHYHGDVIYFPSCFVLLLKFQKSFSVDLAVELVKLMDSYELKKLDKSFEPNQETINHRIISLVPNKVFYEFDHIFRSHVYPNTQGSHKILNSRLERPEISYDEEKYGLSAIEFPLLAEDQTIPKKTGVRCGFCKTHEILGQEPFQKCGRCRAIYYCSRKCQTKHWKKNHKKECSQN